MASIAGASRREVQVVGLISLAHFLSHFYMVCLVPLYPLIQPEIGISWSGIGMAVAAFAIGTGVLQTPCGFLVDRYGGRIVVICGLALLAASVTMIGFVTEPWQLIALMMLAGVGNSVFHPADYSILSTAINDKWIGRAFSVHTFGGNAGVVAAPVVMALVQAQYGWRQAVIGAGLTGVALAAGLLLASRMLGQGGETKKKGGDAPWRELITSRPLMLMFVFYICSAAANAGVVHFSIKAFGDIYGLALGAGAIALTTYQASQLVGVLPGGLLADKTKRYDAVMVACFGLAGLLVVLSGQGLVPFWGVIGMLAVAGLMRGLVNAARDVSVRHIASSHSVGTVFAFVTTGFLLGQAFAPPLYGWLIDLGSPSVVFWTAGAFYGIAVGVIFLNRWMDRRAPVAEAAE
jgi:FSR family fosmidomycin resistance protein-like MFS transporter